MKKVCYKKMKFELFLNTLECLRVKFVVFYVKFKERLIQKLYLLLEFMPYASCAPIIKVLRSAAANAKNNFGFDEKFNC